MVLWQRRERPLAVLPHQTPVPAPRHAGARVLVVDGDAHVREHLQALLQGDGMQVSAVDGGAAALAAVDEARPDRVLLELALPDMSGFELCRALRGMSDVGIIVVTSLAEELDKVLALEIGADDYVTKPFGGRELTLRAKAVLRRRSPPAVARDQPASRLRLDRRLQCAVLDDRQVALSRLEFALLDLLVRRGGRVVTREEILSEVWGSSGSDGSVVDAHVRRLRAKLEVDRHAPTLLVTVRGLGYRVAL